MVVCRQFAMLSIMYACIVTGLYAAYVAMCMHGMWHEQILFGVAKIYRSTASVGISPVRVRALCTDCMGGVKMQGFHQTGS